MIRFIDEHRERSGVELICRPLRPAVQGGGGTISASTASSKPRPIHLDA